ncbi:MAG: transcriptional repressor [Desulfurococcales archaeon]|nr:transcriptional repressor [Desulfurococcales archaeon]
MEHDPIAQLVRVSARLTPQRIVLTRIIMEMIDRHPTLNEVVEEARKVMPGIGVSTTYNTIKMLEEAGIISIIEVDGKMRIDRPHPHVNIACTRTGRIIDVDGGHRLLEEAERLLKKHSLNHDGRIKVTLHVDC